MTLTVCYRVEGAYQKKCPLAPNDPLLNWCSNLILLNLMQPLDQAHLEWLVISWGFHPTSRDLLCESLIEFSFSAHLIDVGGPQAYRSSFFVAPKDKGPWPGTWEIFINRVILMIFIEGFCCQPSQGKREGLTKITNTGIVIFPESQKFAESLSLLFCAWVSC